MWKIAAVALPTGFLLAAMGYGLLPWLGLDVVERLLGWERCVALLAALCLMLAYGVYLEGILKRPAWIFPFVAVVWPLMELGKEFLFNAGINIHQRILVMLLVVIPAGILGGRHVGRLWREYPFFKYLMLFWVWVALYAVFYNAGAVDPRMPTENVWFEGSVGMAQFSTFTNTLAVAVLAGVAALHHRDPEGLFHRFNRLFIGFSAVQSLVTLIGFPFGVFCQNVDGFMRAQGFFLHPNLFAHHMALMLLYGLGLLSYYHGPRRRWMPTWLLNGGLGLCLAAFLLALSKTAMALFCVCGLLLLLLNLPSPVVRRNSLRAVAALGVLMPLGLVAFQAITGQGFFDLLQARIDQPASFDWRQEVWGFLLADMTGARSFLGAGFTASNAFLYLLSYDVTKEVQPLVLVHNAYIGLFYDFGVMGMMFFVAVVSVIWNSAKRLWGAGLYRLSPLPVTMIALSVYFLLGCGFDEIAYAFDSPILYWALMMLLFSPRLQEIA